MPCKGSGVFKGTRGTSVEEKSLGGVRPLVPRRKIWISKGKSFIVYLSGIRKIVGSTDYLSRDTDSNKKNLIFRVAPPPMHLGED